MKNKTSHKKSNWKNYSLGDKIFLGVTYAIIILILFVIIYPLYFTVIASVSDPFEIYRGRVFLKPSGFTLESYKLVFQNDGIWKGYANSIMYTILGTLFNLFLTIPAAYALSKKRMLGRSVLTILFLITMYFSGGMIPTYILCDNLGLIDTRTIMIINGGLSVYNMIVARTYFQNNIPETLYEAARIDGAGEFRIFAQMVIPLSAPIIAVITLFYAVEHWNDYFSALMYTFDVDLQPLQLVLRRILIMNETAFEDAVNMGATAEIMADLAKRAQQAITMKYSLVFISSAPMLILYPFIQKHFVKGIMIGSLKG